MLPEKHEGKAECKNGQYLQVTLVKVSNYTRGLEETGPITYPPGHILQFDESDITEVE